MRILLIGGTGTISQHTVASLLSRGDDVTVFHRSALAPSGARLIVGDRNDAVALADAIAAVRPDVLIDFVCFTPDQAVALADAASGRVGNLVFVSSVDAFGFPQPLLPIAETARRLPGVGVYAQAKQACEDLLLARSDLNVTVTRPTYSMSERFVISLFNHSAVRLMHALRHGAPVLLPDGGTLPIHPSDAADTGRMIAALAGAPQSFGKTYTSGTRGAAMSHRAYVEMIARVVGGTPDFVPVTIAAIDAMALPEAANTVFSNVTRFPLDFAFEQFAADFPDFAWHGKPEEPVRQYLARVDRDGLLDGPPARDLEVAILEQLGRA